MGRNWEEGEREGEARREAEEYCLKVGEWVELVDGYELKGMVKEFACRGGLGRGLQEEKNAAVRRWVSRNWEDFLPKGDPKEEFDYEENRT